MKDYQPTHFRPFQGTEDIRRELEAMSIQYGISINYILQEFVIDGVVQIDSSYVPPACSN